MKGLLIKDFLLLKMQGRFLTVLLAVSLMMAFLGDDVAFVMGYLTIVTPLLALSTVSYDEFDNGNAFLFTLPISRRGYVMEKYVLMTLLGLLSLVVGTVLSICVGLLRDTMPATEILVILPSITALMLLAIAMMLPLHLKFGAEKARIAVIAVFGGLFAIGIAVFKLLPNAASRVEAFFAELDQMNTAFMIASAVLLVFGALAVSVTASMRIMEKKEF